MGWLWSVWSPCVASASASAGVGVGVEAIVSKDGGAKV